MELVVLGVGGGYPREGGAACGYLVEEDGFVLWMDAGTGTMANLQQHVELLDVDAIAVSHQHFDHFLDLYPFWLALRLHPGRDARIPFYAPPGMLEHAELLEDELRDVLDLREVEPGDEFEAGPLRVRTGLMRHPVPTLGMRLEAGGRTLAYTADTGPSEVMVELARSADLLLSEATWLERGEGAGFIHMTAQEAGELGAQAGAGRLLLTHIWPQNDRQAVADRAAEAFGREVTAAAEGMRVLP